MSDIRQFLRYEIPGYILFIYTFLLILPFIEPSKIACLLPWLIEISISGFIIAIPIGWLLYQIFSEHFIEMHDRKKSVELIEKWKDKEYPNLPKYCYGELVNVGIYSLKNDDDNDDEDNEEISFDSQLAAETLRGYWNNYEARWIVAKKVLIFSPILAILIILAGMLVNSSWFITEKYCISFFIFIIFFMAFCIISSYLSKPLNRIMNEINALEVSFVILKKKQIKKTMNNIYKEKIFNKTSEDNCKKFQDIGISREY